MKTSATIALALTLLLAFTSSNLSLATSRTPETRTHSHKKVASHTHAMTAHIQRHAAVVVRRRPVQVRRMSTTKTSHAGHGPTLLRCLPVAQLGSARSREQW